MIKKLLPIVLLSLTLLSCEKKIDSDNISKITYYPTFEMTGDETYTIPLNGSFTEPGLVAIENGTEISVTTSVVGTIQEYSGTTVNTALENEYVISYSASNSDGFLGTTGRAVWVAKTGDLVTSIEGLYTSTIVRNGVVSAQYADLEFVIIYKTGANTYKISDAIGGYYDMGRAYGPDARFVAGNITAVDIPSNNFTYPATFTNDWFGGGPANMTGMTVNPGNKTINFTTTWVTPPPVATYNFVVTLTQVNI